MTLLDQLKRDEGLRLEPYRDSEGLLTIGYGHCLDRKGISKSVAEEMLKDDVNDSEIIRRAMFPWTEQLSEVRRAVFTNLIFNMGGYGLRSFKKFLAAGEHEQWETAAAELLDSKYAKQVGERAQRLATQLIEDRWV